MKIAIAGPISTESIARFLAGSGASLPLGYDGAPLLGPLIGALLERGHEVSAMTTDSSLSPGLREPVVAVGNRFRIYYVAQRRRSFRLEGGVPGRMLDFFRLERDALRQAIALADPDVVHAHWAYEFALAAIASGKPHVVTCHDAPLQVLRYMTTLYRLGRYFMARSAMRRARVLTTVSPYMQQQLAGYASVPISVIPNPLDTKVFEHLAPTARCLRGSSVVKLAMVLNGWNRLKNPEPALRAFGELHRADPRLELHLFGTHFGEGETAERWCRSQELGAGVVFRGAVPHADLLDYLSGMDLLIHPSLEESFGAAITESMALGIPVIGGQVSGAVPWLLEQGAAGVLVDVRDRFAIAQAVRALLDEPARYAALSQRALVRARDCFGVEPVARQYLAVYRQAIELAAMPKVAEEGACE